MRRKIVRFTPCGAGNSARSRLSAGLGERSSPALPGVAARQAECLRHAGGPISNWPPHKSKRGEEIFDGCIIPKRAAHVDIPVHIAWPQDKATAKLKRILSQFVLPMAARARAVAGRLVVAPQHVQQIRVAQARGTVRLALLIDQERKRDAGLLPEQTRVVSVAESDSCQVGAALAEGLFMFAQLRDVLAAEDSTIVAEEDHHGGLPFP